MVIDTDAERVHAGTGPPTTSGPSRTRCATPACPTASSSACRTACDRPMIGGRRPLQGRKPGRQAHPGRAAARRLLPLDRPGPADREGCRQRPDDRPAAGPRPASGRCSSGRPLASEEELGERLSKKKALAIFSSDAISSSAYATEEILRVLIARRRRGARAWRSRSASRSRSLLIVVAISYRQVCLAYPTGGGSVLRLEAELRLADVADRRVGAADRLRDDGRGLDVVGRSSRSRRRFPALFDERVVIGVGCDRPDHDRQPPRAPRGRQHLRRCRRTCSCSGRC